MKQKSLILVLSVAGLLLGVVCCVVYKSKDRKAPEIKIEKTEISYREGDGYDELLQGVSAKDNKDGDLTDAVFIEKILPVEDGKAVVYYAVMDTAKNVGKASQTVEYTAADGEQKKENEKKSKAKDEAATNSKKEEDQKTVSVDEENEAESNADELTPTDERPVIALTTDHMTVPVGGEFDLLSVVKGVADTSDSVATLSTRISADGDYDLSTPGEYTIRYFVVDSDRNISDVKEFTLTVE